MFVMISREGSIILLKPGKLPGKVYERPDPGTDISRMNSGK